LVIDVLGQPMGPIFKGQAVITLEYGTDGLYRNISNKPPT